MKFSEFVVLGRQGLILDPLAFLTPYTTLQDKLFKQFTVLSNLPACHGVLALIYQCLAEEGIEPGNKEFAREFRRGEILWGLLHAFGEGTASVLNITKYEALVHERSSLSLPAIRKDDRVYSKLSYGVLGHYSSPSATWGILSKSGRKLTEQGALLGAGFGTRKDVSFKQALHSWRKGKSWDVEQLKDLGWIFQAHASPSRAEAKVWRALIADYCEQAPQVRSLWLNSMPDKDYQKWHSTPAQYSAGFHSLRRRHAPLAAELSLIERFEQLTGLVQHIFEREYLNCTVELPLTEMEEQLAIALSELTREYIQLPGQAGPQNLLQGLAGICDYREAAELICAHHVAHQKAKDGMPFMEDGELRMTERFNMRSYELRRAELAKAGSAAGRLAVIAHQHRRDWHFQRANTYSTYANAA